LQFEVTNIKGCEYANFEIDDRVTLVAGNNGAGKTSLTRALRVVLARQYPAPAQVNSLLRRGTSQGKISISGDNFDFSYTLPNRKNNETGNPPVISTVAAGVVSVPDLKPAERSTYLQKLIDAEPDKKDLENYLEARLPEWSKTMASEVWTLIDKQGWEKTLKYFTERGTSLKGRWHQTTGESYGSDKAKPEKYMPQGWDSSLEKTSREEIDKKVSDEQHVLESLIRHSAACEQEYKDLEAIADGLTESKNVLFKAQEAEKDADKKFKHCSNLIQALSITAAPKKPADQKSPAPSKPKTIECAGCGMHGLVNGEKLEKYVADAPPDLEAEKKKQELAEFEYQTACKAYSKAKAKYDAERAELQKDLDKASETLKNCHLETGRLTADWHRCQAAAKKMAELGKPSENVASLEDIEKQRSVIEGLQVKRAAYIQKKEADDLHAQVERNQHVIDALDPEGVRGKKLAGKLGEFNEILEEFCEMANYPTIRIDRDMDISYGGEVYDEISEGEQYRVQKIFQLVIADIQDAACVVIDRTEVLDAPGQQGLFILLNKIQMPAVAFMKISKSLCPDLASAGLGKTLWMEGAKLQPIKKAVAA
jgi:energy-coupling factor transporter ATP-binding protein EcfA2